MYLCKNEINTGAEMPSLDDGATFNVRERKETKL